MNALQHIIDFLYDFFNNLSLKKIFGAILVLIGVSLMQNIAFNGSLNKAIFLTILGFVIAGIGILVIYYDIASDKSKQSNSDLEIFVEAHKDGGGQKATGWHMEEGSQEKLTKK